MSGILPERFWSKVRELPSGCWEWTAARNRDGYGVFKVTGDGMRLAHRVCYEAMVVEIPAGLELDHECRNHWCVNPWHLDPVTYTVNQLRGQTFMALNRAKTECPQGHRYAGTNLYVNPTTGDRHCRACLAAHQRDLRARRAAERSRAAYGLAYAKGGVL